VTVNWEGSTDTISGLTAASNASGTVGGTSYTWTASTRALSMSHQYLDDNPTGTSSDVYSVALSVSDDDLGTSSTSANVTVNNVNPVIDTLNITSPINEFTTATLNGTYHDVGTQDTHKIDVNWGD